MVVPEEDEVDPEVEEPEAQEVEPDLEDHHYHPCPHSLWMVSTNRRHHLDLADSLIQERDTPNLHQCWICPLCLASKVLQFHHCLAERRG